MPVAVFGPVTETWRITGNVRESPEHCSHAFSHPCHPCPPGHAIAAFKNSARRKNDGEGKVH